MSPTIEGMEKAHCLFLIFTWTGLDNRREKDFDEASVDGIDHNRKKNADEWIWQDFRQEGKRRKSDNGENMSENDRGSISDFIYEVGREQIDEELNEKIHRDEKGDFR